MPVHHAPMSTWRHVLSAAAILGSLSGCAHDASSPADHSATSRAFDAMPRKKGPRVTVAIYEFRSSIYSVPAGGATDMFTTALVKSGYFAVAERQRLMEGVVREKQLNEMGQTTGSNAATKLVHVKYIFEGSITEFNEDSNGEGGLKVGGAELSKHSATASVGLDVRVIEAASSLVVDAINVRKPIEQGRVGVSGLGQLAQNVLALRGDGPPPLNPDIALERSTKDSLDRALRECIEAAVLELVNRFGTE